MATGAATAGAATGTAAAGGIKGVADGMALGAGAAGCGYGGTDTAGAICFFFGFVVTVGTVGRAGAACGGGNRPGKSPAAVHSLSVSVRTPCSRCSWPC